MIYKITINNKVYIGQTNNLNKRKNDHLSALNKNNHHNLYLQRAYNKYGQFKFEVVEECSEKLLDEREIHYIKEYDSMDNGYNMQTGGHNGRYVLVGHPREDEIRKNMSNAQKGRVISGETRKKMGEAALGRKHSEVTKKKMSIGRKGKRVGKENPMFGKKLTEENKSLLLQGNKNYWENISDEDLKVRNKKVSDANKGRVISGETRKKLSNALKGKPAWNKGKKDIYSEETLKKMSGAKRGQVAWNKKDYTKEEIEEIKDVCLREGDIMAGSKALGYESNALRRVLLNKNIIPIYDKHPYSKEAKVIGYEDISLSADTNSKIEGFVAATTKRKKYTIDEIKEACLKEGNQSAAAKSLGYHSVSPIGSRLKRAGIKIIYDNSLKSCNSKIIGFETFIGE